MDKQQFSYISASKIYNYYYTLALKEFTHTVADRLAKIPADYVYNQLMENYPNCFINENCCLKYCNERLDTEFKTFSPEFKRDIYNKALNVQSNVSNSEINLQLKANRRKIKNLFYDAARETRDQQENDISILLDNISLKRKNNLETVFKKLNLK